MIASVDIFIIQLMSCINLHHTKVTDLQIFILPDRNTQVGFFTFAIFAFTTLRNVAGNDMITCNENSTLFQ
jgi:hypothetical protein